MKKKDNIKVHTGEWRPFPNHATESKEEKQFVTSEDLLEEGRRKGMVQGIAVAINYMYRGNDEVAIWKSAGLTIEECIANEVDEFDMEMLLIHRKELEG